MPSPRLASFGLCLVVLSTSFLATVFADDKTKSRNSGVVAQFMPTFDLVTGFLNTTLSASHVLDYGFQLGYDTQISGISEPLQGFSRMPATWPYGLKVWQAAQEPWMSNTTVVPSAFPPKSAQLIPSIWATFPAQPHPSALDVDALSHFTDKILTIPKAVSPTVLLVAQWSFNVGQYSGSVERLTGVPLHRWAPCVASLLSLMVDSPLSADDAQFASVLAALKSSSLAVV